MTKNRFLGAKSQKFLFSLYFLVKIFKVTISEGNPWPFYVLAHPFGLFAHLFGFDITLKNFLLLISLLISYIDRNVLQIFHNQNLRNLLF